MNSGLFSRTLEQKAAVTQNPGERIIDLVGYARSQLADRCQFLRLIHLPLGFGELVRHIVERVGQHADLIAFGQGDPVVKIPGRHLARCRDDLLERPEHDPVDQQIDHQTHRGDGDDAEQQQASLAGLHLAIHLAQRHGNIQHSQDFLCRGVRVAIALPTARLVVDGIDDAQDAIAPRRAEKCACDPGISSLSRGLLAAWQPSQASA